MKGFLSFILLLFLCGSMSAQQSDVVDFLSIKADISFEPAEGLVKGSAVYRFKILKETDSIVLDARNHFSHYEVRDSNFKVIDNYSGNHIVFKNTNALVKDSIYQFKLEYSVQPKKALYFVDDQIWTQGQGKYTSNWLPSIDDVNDKIEFDLTITYKNGYEVLANGILKDKDIGEQTTTWHYDMQEPMSSYLVALAIGKYSKQSEISKSGIPLTYYFYPEDSLKVEPTYRYSKEVFDVLEDEIGVPFPWENYRQVPVKDFLYSGMENTTLTIFSDSFVVDSIGYNDKTYLTVNAHELAHQWFGDDVTATSSEHHWLQEGFATYYALLAERAILGDEHYYWQLFENAQELIAQEDAGESTSLLNPKSSSTTFYKKGAWALHILREQVGDSAFKAGVIAYLDKHAYANVDTNDFIAEIEQASGFDLGNFEDDWLYATELPEDAIVKSLKTSAFMREYFDIDCETYSEKCKDYLVSNISDKAKIKVISQIPNHIEAEAFKNSLKVRQAISGYVQNIPEAIKYEYEGLLNDRSYITIENALYNLWANFPEDRVKYLQKTKNVIGFNDKNVRLLWLALNLNTIEYQPQKKQLDLNELIGYSLPNEHFEARMNAFRYLKLLGAFEKQSIASLIQATKHPVWQFSKFAKQLLAELKANPELKSVISELSSEKAATTH